jgi:hypothetical protein
MHISLIFIEENFILLNLETSRMNSLHSTPTFGQLLRAPNEMRGTTIRSWNVSEKSDLIG